MTTIIQPVDDYAVFNNLVKQRLGIEGVNDDNTINFVGIGEAVANADPDTSNVILGALAVLVTQQEILPLIFKGTGVDIVTSRGEYSQSVGYLQRSRPKLISLESDLDVYNPTAGASSDPFKNYEVEFYTNYFYKIWQAKVVRSLPERWGTGIFINSHVESAFIEAIRSTISFQVAASLEAITFAALRGSMALNLTSGNGDLAINILGRFNTATGGSLLAKDAMQSPDFLRYTAGQLSLLRRRMAVTTVQYNEKKYPNALDMDDAHVLLLADFSTASEVNLQSDTFHKELVALPGHRVVPSWQGPSLADNGAITFESSSLVKDKFQFTNPDTPPVPISVGQGGVIAHIASRKRFMIEELGSRTTTMFDPVGLKTNIFVHLSGRVSVDDYEPAVTLYVAD